MRLILFLCAVGCVVLSGCDSLTDTSAMVRGLSSRGQPKTHAFAGDPHAVYTAAKASLDAIDFRYTGGGPAQGRLEALSGLSQGDSARSTRQVALKATFEPSPDGGTEVSLLLSEYNEADSSNHPGMTTETPLTDTPLYEVFFRELQKNLAAAPKG